MPRGKKELSVFLSVIRTKQNSDLTVIWPAVNILCNAIVTQYKTNGLAYLI